MTLRLFHPFKSHVTLWQNASNDLFPNFPFSAMVPRWRHLISADPISEFERISANEQNNQNKKAPKQNVGQCSDDKNFTFKFDLSGFKPSDIKVKMLGQKVLVEAESEVNEQIDGCHSFCHRHYHRSLVLPKNVEPELLKSSINKQGILSITAPLRTIEDLKPKEKEIPIEQESVACGGTSMDKKPKLKSC